MPEAGKINLLIQTAFLGDLLLSIPLMKKMKELWPNEELHLVCRKGVGSFFKQVGLVDYVYEIKKGERKSYQSILAEIKSRQVKYLISPHTSLRTGLFVRRIQAEHKISFSKWWNGLFFNERLNRISQLPDALRQLKLVESFDHNLKENIHQYQRSERAFKVENHRLSSPPMWASMSVREQLLSAKSDWVDLMRKLEWEKFEGKPKVLIFPGSVWATKKWIEEGYIETALALQKKGAQIIVMGAGSEVEIAQQVAAKVPEAVSLAGVTTIYESALVLCHSDLMIGNDSASVHLASACETPLISIFGPTVLEFGFRPWSEHAYVVEKKGLFCRPCGAHGHHRCPRGTHECMTTLSAKEVIQVAEDLV